VVLPTVAAFAELAERFSNKARKIKKDKFRVQNTLLFFFKSGDVEKLTELTIFDLLTNVFRPLNAVFVVVGLKIVIVDSMNFTYFTIYRTAESTHFRLKPAILGTQAKIQDCLAWNGKYTVGR